MMLRKGTEWYGFTMRTGEGLVTWAVSGLKVSRTQEARKCSKKHCAVKQWCALLVLPLLGRSDVCPNYFPFPIISMPSIIWGGGLGQDWMCRVVESGHAVLNSPSRRFWSTVEGHDILPNLTPPCPSEILLVNYQNIEILRNATKSGEKTIKQASLSFFSFDKGTWKKEVKLESK